MSNPFVSRAIAPAIVLAFVSAAALAAPQ